MKKVYSISLYIFFPLFSMAQATGIQYKVKNLGNRKVKLVIDLSQSPINLVLRGVVCPIAYYDSLDKQIDTDNFNFTEVTEELTSKNIYNKEFNLKNNNAKYIKGKNLKCYYRSTGGIVLGQPYNADSSLNRQNLMEVFCLKSENPSKNFETEDSLNPQNLVYAYGFYQKNRVSATYKISEMRIVNDRTVLNKNLWKDNGEPTLSFESDVKLNGKKVNTGTYGFILSRVNNSLMLNLKEIHSFYKYPFDSGNEIRIKIGDNIAETTADRTSLRIDKFGNVLIDLGNQECKLEVGESRLSTLMER